jgi:membrane-bound lytic murein transglycosylase B
MPIQAGGIAAESEVQAFIDKLVTDEGFDKKALGALFKQVEKQDRILELMDRPAERSLEWWEYRNLFINDLSVNRGVEHQRIKFLLSRKNQKRFQLCLKKGSSARIMKAQRR